MLDNGQTTHGFYVYWYDTFYCIACCCFSLILLTLFELRTLKHINWLHLRVNVNEMWRHNKCSTRFYASIIFYSRSFALSLSLPLVYRTSLCGWNVLTNLVTEQRIAIKRFNFMQQQQHGKADSQIHFYLVHFHIFFSHCMLLFFSYMHLNSTLLL